MCGFRQQGGGKDHSPPSEAGVLGWGVGGGGGKNAFGQGGLKRESLSNVCQNLGVKGRGKLSLKL